MLTAQQIANRQRGVGGSEIYAALGKDPRCSRVELYQRKIGELPEQDFSGNERIHFGELFEPLLRKEFARRTGKRVIQRHQTLYHPSAPLVGHVDGWIASDRCGVEIKTADRFEAEEFGEVETDQVPVRYLLQCSAYMAITDAREWHLAVLIGGNDFRIYRIPRDEAILGAIVEGAREFWHHVETMTPPDPRTPEEVRLRWPKDLGTSIEATPTIVDTVERLRDLRPLIKSAEDEEAQLIATIQQYMQEHATLTDDAQHVLTTWRTAKPSRHFDVKAFADEYPDLFEHFQHEAPGSRRFLLKKIRGTR
jgi:putative phage-type endonuclease